MKGYNLRGTSGSGKTTVARAVLRYAQCVPMRHESGRTRVYVGIMKSGEPVYVLGDYNPINGGCDTIPKVDIVARLIDEIMAEPHDGWLFYEGLMISHMLGTVGQAQFRTGLKNHYLAFLDTPLDTCLERVQQRRILKGTTKPFNPNNTIKDWDAVRLARKNAIVRGYQVVDIPYQSSVETVLSHLEGGHESIPTVKSI